MIYFLLVQIYGISINKEKYIHNKMTNIKEQLLTFNTVDEIVETQRGCKSLNGTLYIIRLWSEVGIYDFKNEMSDVDDLKNYIILTEIPGFETEYEYIGIVDGVRDLTDWAFRNLSFPKGTKMMTIANCCEKIVEDIKELYASIKYSEWINYKLTPEEIMQRVQSTENDVNNITESSETPINEMEYETFKKVYDEMRARGQKDRANKLKNDFFDIKNAKLPTERIKYVDLGPETNTPFLYYSLILINDDGEECVTNIDRSDEVIWTDKRGVYRRFPKTHDRKLAKIFADEVKKWAEDLYKHNAAKRVDKNMFIA